MPEAPARPGVRPKDRIPGNGGGGGGNGGGNGGGGNGGGGGGGNGGGDGDGDTIIYCYYCGSPWWDCLWCQYWTPIWWGYCGYNYNCWQGYWNPAWYDSFYQFHKKYNYEDYYPSIYTPAALMVDPLSEAIEFLDRGAKLFREGKYLEALHMFRLATLVDLNFAIPKFAYAHALFALGLYDYAAYEIRLGFYLLREWVDIGGDLTLMYGNPADFDEQLTALFVHLKVWPNDEDALLVLGYVAYFSGDLYLSEKAFERLILSLSSDTAFVAGLFINAIQRIKEQLAQDNQDPSILVDDGVTIEEILQQ